MKKDFSSGLNDIWGNLKVSKTWKKANASEFYPQEIKRFKSSANHVIIILFNSRQISLNFSFLGSID